MLNCRIRFTSDFPVMAKAGDYVDFINGVPHYDNGNVSQNTYHDLEEFQEYNADAEFIVVEKKSKIKTIFDVLSAPMDLFYTILAWVAGVMIIVTLLNDAIVQFAIWTSSDEETVTTVAILGTFIFSVLIKIGIWLYRKAIN